VGTNALIQLLHQYIMLPIKLETFPRYRVFVPFQASFFLLLLRVAPESAPTMAAPSDIRRLLSSSNIEIDYNTRKDDIVGLSSQLGLLSTQGRISVPRLGGHWFKSNPRHQETNEGRIALRSILPFSFGLSYLPVLEYHCATALSVVLRDCLVVV